MDNWEYTVFSFESSSNYETALQIMYCPVASSGGVQLSVEELMRLPVQEDHTEGNVHFLQRLGDRSCLDAKAANKVSLLIIFLGIC
jgi:hypothetical protein